MCRAKRSGFTLVEMLVVLSVVVVVAVIVIPFVSNTNDKDIVPRGARYLQGALIQARTRAQAEHGQVGIRLLPTTIHTNNNNVIDLAWSEQIEYVHDPGDFIDGFTVGPLPQPTPNSMSPYNFPLPPGYSVPPWNGQYSIVAGPLNSANFFNDFANQPGGDSRLGGPVKPGDYIEFLGNGQVFQVIGFPGQGNAIPGLGIPPGLANPSIPLGDSMILSRVMNFFVWIPLGPPFQPNYRVMRKPRSLPGEKPLEMPRGVVIDLTLPVNVINGTGTGLSAGDRDNSATNPASPYNPNGVLWMNGLSTQFNLGSTVDIMFSPAGTVVGDAAVNDIIYLWLHPRAEVNNWLMRNPSAALGDAANQAFVVVYSKNGATHGNPVNQGTPGGSIQDPYIFAKTARAQSSGGL